MNRKPKFVEIPSVPTSTSFDYDNKVVSTIEDRNITLMDKLGLHTSQRLVKTTTHVHPTLNNHPIAAVQSTEIKKKPTTSPASTLSDKGIGSSVGSFDSDFRHDTSLSYCTRITYDPNKTGSLDSRTQEVNEKPMPVHSRSSSDIICQSAANGEMIHPTLAEQTNAPLWNHDPRRLINTGANESSLANAARAKRPTTRRPRSRCDLSAEQDTDVKKLPQLCPMSPSNSSVSCSQSIPSTPSVSTTEIGSTLGLNHCNAQEVFPDSLSLSSTSSEIAPPLPPKASHLRSLGIGSSYPLHNFPPVSSSMFSDHPYNDYSNYQNQPGMENMNPANAIMPGYASRSVCPPTHLTTPNPYVPTPHPVWAQDYQREAQVLVGHGHPGLPGSALINPALRLGESAIKFYPGHNNLTASKFHCSSNGSFESESSAFGHTESDLSGSRDEDAFKRQAVARSSTRSNPGEKRRIPHGDPQARVITSGPIRTVEVSLSPLHFNLPQAITSETKFVGREWLFAEITNIFNKKGSSSNKVAIILGDNGHGKTSIIEHLVAFSYQGRSNARRTDLDTLTRFGNSICRSSSPLNRLNYSQNFPGSSNHSSRTGSPCPSVGSGASSRTGSQASLTEDSCRKVSSQVVAYHFCQAESNKTCYVPEFVHSIASQMSLAPQLTAYREILNDPQLRGMLSMRNCILNPSQALRKAIIEPLITLRQSNKLPKSNIVILVDAINEAELYRPDYGFSILSFIHEHLPSFPDFIKLVVTCRTSEKSLVADFPGQFISLDCDNQRVSRDMQAYLAHRFASSSVLSNLTLAGKPDPGVAQKQLTQHMLKTANGNFLYLRMALDLIDTGAITPKSSGFKVVPMNLHEIFLLLCNLRFRSYTSFDEVRDIVSVALASLYPLKDEQLYQAVCSVLPPCALPRSIFQQQISMLEGLLVLNSSHGTRSFYHPIFREWLMGHIISSQGTLQSSSRFKTDVKRGNFLLVSVLSSLSPDRLNSHATLELAHHVLKAGMFKAKSKQAGASASDLNARFMAEHSKQLTAAMLEPRNLFYPTMKICKLLLKAGANPNVNTQVYCNAPPLAIAAHTGCIKLAELFLMFDADVNYPACNGMTPLAFAAAAGRMDVIKLLLKYRPALSQCDQNGHTPLLHALSRNHSNVAKLLLSRDLYSTAELNKMAAQQALVASATTGDIDFMEFLLENPNFVCDVDALELSGGESPLTSAAARGKSAVCEYLVKQYRAKIYLRNKAGLTPLLCAIKHDEWDTTDALLNCGASIEACDVGGRTPLIFAASCGYLSILELLITRGADINAVDKEGMTALGWSAIQGHDHCVRSLIGRSNIHHCDINGRTALDLAAFNGDPQIVEILLDAGADIRHSDKSGMCALDRAIGCQHITVVSRLLARGATIQSTSWSMADGKPEITLILLEAILDEGNYAYKREDFSTARDLYTSALRQIGELSLEGIPPPQHPTTIIETCAQLLLGHSRCSRKLDCLEEAESIASRSLELKPHWHEALYVRSRVLRERSRLDAALRDVIEAERNAPNHNLKEIKTLMKRIKDDIRKSGSRFSRSPSASCEINVPKARPRLNSASSCHGNIGVGRSPSPSIGNVSQSYQPQPSVHPSAVFHNNSQKIIHANSQESLIDPIGRISMPTNGFGDYPSGSVRRAPSIAAPWRHPTSELSRSLSSGPRVNPMLSYSNRPTMTHSGHGGLPQQPHFLNRLTGSGGEMTRGAMVTDL